MSSAISRRGPHVQSANEPMALVVDDCEEDRKRVYALLRGCGFRRLEASDAGQALSLARRQRPSLGVLAIDLPGMSGAELAWRMREDGVKIPAQGAGH